MQNVLSDDVAPLTTQLFVGNAFSRTLEFPGWFIMPTSVEIHAYYSKGGEELADDFRPTISISGQQLTINYPAQTGLINSGYQEVSFNGRKVWAGSLTVSYSTTLVAKSEITTVYVAAPSSVSVALTLFGVAPLQIGDLRSVDGTTLERWTGTEWEMLNINTGTPAQTNFGLPRPLPMILN
ncbi:hypothetical protein [Spirosoma sp. 48-14]|uniref:hypothetical protein n=1 Tax=Spirosoma sp. 48-14 TaxID=1895854 RepID=UPI00095E40AB|nr:hypothetical protein [Spirosoma sp. 48-14]OJW78461.1 MAG: hypothetical protein BGO59_31145 [Spirosoma sp. 48-14]